MLQPCISAIDTLEAPPPPCGHCESGSLLAHRDISRRRINSVASLIGRSGVKRFQTIHDDGVDVSHGLVLLFGFGAGALPSWDSKTRRNNLRVGLAIRLMAGPSGHAISPHPSSREGHHSTTRWKSRFLLSDLVLHCHAAAACCRVQQNSVPSTQMRCMITAKRRASATTAFFKPRRLAIASPRL